LIGQVSPLGVLLVEDDDAQAHFVIETFERAERGCVTRTVRLKEALRHLATTHFDVVLLDLTLPDAFDLMGVNAIRQAAPDVPLIVLTGSTDPTLGFRITAAGADDYLQKGQIDANLLVRSIRYARERHAYLEGARRLVTLADLVIQNEAKEKRAAELIVANTELAFQNQEKEKRAGELAIANRELVVQNNEKEKRAAELIVANAELAFQNQEKEKRAAELAIANRELVVQNNEKEKRAAELTIANAELAFQNGEREKRAAELNVANAELAFQNDEKEKRAEELAVANRELAFHNDEKEKRAAELTIANAELAFQNGEREKRAAELNVANRELAFQNDEKEKRAEELAIANRELVVQNSEKEKRAAELAIANNRLTQFSFMASHELQEPLRTVVNYMQVFEEDYVHLLDDNARKYLQSVNGAVKRMSMLVKALLDFSRLGHSTKRSFVDCNALVQVVISDLQTIIRASNADIKVFEMPHLNVYEVEIRQVFQNLIVNAIKFRSEGSRPRIEIRSEKIAAGWQFSVADNGIGINPIYFERIFDIFQRLHTDEEYEGTGIGLSTCKKVVESHQGTIRVESSPPYGATFYFTIPQLAA
jgi:signal transduction histidine kinase